MIASESYNLRQLNNLGDDDMEKVREAIFGVSSHYFKRLSRGGAGRAYVKKEEMRKWLWNQGRESLAKTIRILSILSETKVYLFWTRDWMGEAGDDE